MTRACNVHPSWNDDITAMWHVDSYSRYPIIREGAATTDQVSHKQQSNHDDDDSHKTNEVEAAAAGDAVVVAAGAPSPQTNEPRITKNTGGNGYRKQVK